MGLGWIGMGRKFAFRQGGISWSTYWTPPNKSDILAGGDGTIIEDGGNYYLRSVNNKNFLITDYDFASDWTKGIPYKSAATISAPVGDAELIAADINNYLYALDGTPNQIPVVSMFQDIDYEHKIFFKHAAQVVDVNDIETYEPRVLEWAIYGTVKSGATLTECQTYFGVPAEVTTAVKWVDPVNGDDTTGDGSKGSPWKTLAKSTTGATANDTVYVKSGVCDLTTKWDNSPNTLHHYCIGLNKTINSGVARDDLLNFNPGTLSGFYFDGTNTTETIIDLYTAGSPDIISCRFDNYVYAIRGLLANIPTIKYCVGVPASGTSFFFGRLRANCVIDTCYTNSTHTAFIGEYTAGCDVTILNSKLKASYIVSYQGGALNFGDLIFKGNIFTASGLMQVNDIGSCTIYNNIIYGILFKFIDTTPLVTNIDIQNNTISSDNVATAVSLVNKNLVFKNNIINHNSTGGSCLNLRSSGDAITADVGDNTFNTLGDGLPISFGDDTFVIKDKITGEFYNNKVLGNLYYGGGVSIHGITIWANAGIKVHHNYINGWYLAIVLKGGNCDYATTPIYSNIIVKGQITVKGVSNTPIYNNTIFRGDENNYVITMNEDEVANQALGTVIKNNILINNYSGNNQALYQILTSCTAVIDNNILYNVNANIGYVVDTNKELAAWQALGYDVNSVVLSEAQLNALFEDMDNLDFALPASSEAIAKGADLGASYDDGLNTTTDWGGDSELPSVVTKEQGATWDCGAYVH